LPHTDLTHSRRDIPVALAHFNNAASINLPDLPRRRAVPLSGNARAMMP